jgi:uncharacterized protein (TIGR00299 family) protein
MTGQSPRRPTSGSAARHLWVDASAGVAGDMLLGALLDAGADLDSVCRAVEAVLPQTVRLVTSRVQRAGLAALKVDVETRHDEHPHRAWSDLRDTLSTAEVSDRVRRDALAVFGRLANAEGAVHGIPALEVQFHEVGAWDSVADIVGVCAALADLDVGSVRVSPIALGSGSVRAAHGRLPVPTPAVLRMVSDWQVLAGGDGELATPTGVALLTALATDQGPLSAMRVLTSGVGAGTRDPDDHANVVRVVLGEVTTSSAAGAAPDATMVVLETNVDDLDPRVWPTVLAALLDAGAADAWLTPILMKKGRPAHTLSVLSPPDLRERLRDMVFGLTSTLGIREHEVCRPALDRSWVPLDVRGHRVRVKVGARAGVIVNAAPEFDDVVAAAGNLDVPVLDLLDQARAAAVAADLVPGAGRPDAAAPAPHRE